MKIRTQHKLFLIYIGIIIICIISIGILFTAMLTLKNYHLERLTSQLKSNALLVSRIIKPYLIKGDPSSIDYQCKILGKEITTRVTILDKKGTVLGDSKEDPNRMENYTNNSEIKQALTKKIGVNLRHSNIFKIDCIYLATPIIENDQVIGVTLLSLPLNEVKAKITHVYNIIILGILLVSSIALGVSFLVIKMINKPLQDMSSLVKAIKNGNLTKKTKIYSRDEINKLADIFNQMAKELKAKIQTITEDRDKIEAILTNIAEGVIAIDENERLILFNPTCEKIFGFSKSKVIGKYFWEVIRNNELNNLFGEVIEKGETKKCEITLFLPQERTFEVHISSLKRKEGLGGIIAVLHDITDLKNQEKMRIEFVANVSHELRTPLTSIKGFVETLKDGAIDDPKINRKFLSIIEKHTERLNNLINDLLQLSQIEFKETKMELQKTNLKELVEEVLFDLKGAIEQKEHKIVIDIPPDLDQVEADPERIKQVFINLLDNAIKFTPQNGNICIRAKAKGKYIQVEISDTGIGIPQEHQKRIFERFYRVDKARSRKLGGTGLGLSIVKHIIYAHGGEVGVESEPGKGSKFFFTLPKDKDPS